MFIVLGILLAGFCLKGFLLPFAMIRKQQKIMLAMSDDDIQNGRMIDQHALNEQELEWLTKNLPDRPVEISLVFSGLAM